jgi:hypothetical protein
MTDVGGYYATFGDREWQRLERDEGVVEFDVTTACRSNTSRSA